MPGPFTVRCALLMVLCVVGCERPDFQQLGQDAARVERRVARSASKVASDLERSAAPRIERAAHGARATADEAAQRWSDGRQWVERMLRLLSGKPPAHSGPPDPALVAQFDAAVEQIECNADGCTVPEALVAALVRDPGLLSSQLRVTAAHGGGFGLHFGPGAVFDRLGFHDGDVVQGVNGRPLQTRSHAIAAFLTMQRRPVYRVEVRRGGATVVRVIRVQGR